MRLNFLNTANVHDKQDRTWESHESFSLPEWESNLHHSCPFFLMEVVTWSSPEARGLRNIKEKIEYLMGITISVLPPVAQG